MLERPKSAIATLIQFKEEQKLERNISLKKQSIPLKILSLMIFPSQFFLRQVQELDTFQALDHWQRQTREEVSLPHGRKKKERATSRRAHRAFAWRKG